MIRGTSAALIAASIWVYGPVLLKLVSGVHSSPRTAFVISCAVLTLAWLHLLRARARSGQWRQDLASFGWGVAFLGGAPALLISGLLRTDAVSVALICGLLIFIVPALAWLLRKAELDSGFLLAFVLASGGIYAMLHGRVRWDEATVLGDVLTVFGAVLLVCGTMRDPLRAAGEQSPSRTNVIRISGAALFSWAWRLCPN